MASVNIKKEERYAVLKIKTVMRSKLFRKTFLTYMLMFMIPVLVFSIFNYLQASHTISEVAIIESKKDAKEIVSVVEDQLANIQTLGGRAGMLSWVWKLSTENNVFDYEFNPIRKKEIINDLRIFQADMGLINNLILFFPKKEIAISSKGWFTQNDFFNYLGKSDSIHALKPRLKESFNYTILNKGRLEIQNRSVLWLMHSIDPLSEPRAQLVFLIDVNKLTQFIQSISADNMHSLIIDQEGFPVIQVGSSTMLNKKDGVYIEELSKSFGWNYQIVFDISSSEEQQQQFLFMIIIILSTIAFGPPLSFFLAYLSYKPVRKLMSHILPENYTEPNHMVEGYEYGTLEQAFNKLNDDNQHMHDRINEYLKYTKNDILIHLLKGYFYQTNLNEDLSYYGIDYSEDNQYCVLIIRLIDHDSASMDRIKRSILTVTLLEGMMDYESYDYNIINLLEEDSIVILSDNKCELESTGIQSLINKIETFLNNIENTEAYVWHGKIEPGLIGISKSYQYAKQASEITSMARQIHNKADIAKNFYYPTDWEVQLINNLKMGKEEAVRRILDAIRAENDERNLDTETMDALFQYINNTITRVAAELNISLSVDEIKNYVAAAEDIIKVKHPLTDKLWKYVYGACQLLCERTRVSQEDDVDIPNEVVHYIDSNYMNSNLSLQGIADQLQLSPSAVSKAFKKGMGINFYDYVTRLRMEKAKTLLIENTLPISKICGLVGYDNESSFRRAFQRYEGISVSEFRDSIY